MSYNSPGFDLDLENSSVVSVESIVTQPPVAPVVRKKAAVTLPPALRECMRDASVHALMLNASSESIGFLKAFRFFLSGQRDAPYEEISRQEITLYNAQGDEIGSCLPEDYFACTWSSDSDQVDEGETVREALVRLDATNIVSFVSVVFYNHNKMKNVKVYRV